MERNIRLLIEYDGGRYDGWQRLGKGHGVTIQGKLEDVLGKMTGEKIELIGAGRTDAGVHAYEQVANFHTNSQMKCWEMKYYLNRYLPGDIAVNRSAVLLCLRRYLYHRFHARLICWFAYWNKML